MTIHHWKNINSRKQDQDDIYNDLRDFLNRRSDKIGEDMYGKIKDANDVEFGKAPRSRNMTIQEVLIINQQKREVLGGVGKMEIQRIGRSLQKKRSDAYKSFDEEKKLSDDLEDLFGKEGYMKIFFTESEQRQVESADARYPSIANSTNPEVVKLKNELNPARLYDAYKYKPRIRTFNEEGVRKMLESPEISKAEKKYLVFNLDKIQDGGTIDLNFKELIYNRFAKQEDKDG